MGLLASLLLSSSCLLPPVTAPIADPFREPACPWCPGNRGLTYDIPAGTPVRAAAAGTVTFAGPVAGTFYVVVEHGDGLRATYGELAGSHLAPGDAVVTGATVGLSAGGLHFGVRRGDRYIDPAPSLGRLVERARLVPTDGTPARPAPPPRLQCPATSSLSAASGLIRPITADRTRSLPVR
jgi:murein DD-endopeptidase MepM/ murein hydrolase activator NlpD